MRDNMEQDNPMVNHPSHYNQYPIEVIDMMRRIFGEENTWTWCIMTAYKYRMRLGSKPGNPIEQDLAKEQWYLDKAAEIRSQMMNGHELELLEDLKNCVKID